MLELDDKQKQFAWDNNAYMMGGTFSTFFMKEFAQVVLAEAKRKFSLENNNQVNIVLVTSCQKHVFNGYNVARNVIKGLQKAGQMPRSFSWVHRGTNNVLFGKTEATDTPCCTLNDDSSMTA